MVLKAWNFIYIYLQNFSSWKWKSNISSPIRWKISEKLVSELISTLKILFGIISYLILLHKTQSSTQNRKVYHKASSLKNPSIYKLMENLLIALALAEQTDKKACIHFSGPPFFILKIWLKIEIWVWVPREIDVNSKICMDSSLKREKIIKWGRLSIKICFLLNKKKIKKRKTEGIIYFLKVLRDF